MPKDSKTTTVSKRPAVAKNTDKLEKAVVAKDGSKIAKAAKTADALKNPKASTPTSSNTAKKLTKRSNQSSVAKGEKPGPRYISKGK